MLRVGLIGCGRISKRHSELLGNKQIKNAVLAAVCDIDVQKAEYIGSQYKIPVYSDMDTMMQNEHLDIVVILTESGNHAKHVIRVAKYGCHIMVEKPMALTLQDADQMIQACDEHGARLFVVKQNRFNVPVQKLREAYEKRRFGKLILGTVRVRWCRDQKYYDQDKWRGTWKMDGGVLANQASHHIDLLEWMMGDVESVFAKSTTALVDIEAEDTAIVVLKFVNGALGIIEATTAVRPKDLEGSLSVLGSEGTVEIGGFAVNQLLHWNFTHAEGGDDNVISQYSENPPNVYGYGHKAYYDHVVDSILNNKQQLVDGLEGRKSLEVILSIYESIETGREVIVRFQPNKCKLGI